MSPTVEVRLTLLLLLVVSGAAGADVVLRTVTIGDAFDGGMVHLTTGETLVVRLPSNPGTGYSWSVQWNDAAILQPRGEPVLEKPEAGLGGAPGAQVFRFRALRAGSTGLAFAYHRPWEKKEAPARLYRVTVVVTPTISRQALRLTLAEAGSKIYLAQGQTFTVKLPSTPSTGYSWAVTRIAPSVLEAAGPPKSEKPAEARPGAQGAQNFTFRVAGEGAAVLELAYRRPGEKDKPPVKTFRILIAAAGVTNS